MENVTFNDMPECLTQILSKVSNLEKLLLENSNIIPHESDQWFDLTGLCNYLPDKPSKQTVYGWVSMGNVPHHKGGKKLRFLKSEIDEWLKLGRRKTQQEIEQEADLYLSKNKKRTHP